MNQKNNYQFPNAKPVALVREELAAVLDEIPGWDDTSPVQRLGFAMGPPAEIAHEVYTQFALKNTNNVGLHTTDDLTGTRKLEQEVIRDLKGLLNANDGVEGYLTSGGTEGNIYGLWVGREYLKSQNPGSKPVLVVNRYTHSSILKAAKILDLAVQEIASEAGRYDINALADFLKKSTGVIVAATAGYYSTGQVDDIESIAKSIIDKKHYLHVDAAIGGYCLPFTNPLTLFDFRIPQVGSVTVDPHKLGGMGYSCGAVLFRSEFQFFIQHTNELAGVNDVTLIGSRPGAAAAALWALHRSQGTEGYESIIKKCLAVKAYFMSSLKKWDPEVVILENAGINHFAFSPSLQKQARFTPEVQAQFRLVSNPIEIAGEEKPFFHIYVMPHITSAIVDSFMEKLHE